MRPGTLRTSTRGSRGQQCQAQLAAIEGDTPCIHGPMNTSGARTWRTKKHITPDGAQNRLKHPVSCIGTRVRLPHMQRWHLTSIVCMHKWKTSDVAGRRFVSNKQTPFVAQHICQCLIPEQSIWKCRLVLCQPGSQ